MFSVKLTVQHGFHPRHFSSPQNAITLQTGNTSYHQAQGRYGGTGMVPSVSCSCFVFRVRLKEFSRAKKNKTVFYSLEKPYAA
jgi:hypothetical protein